MLCFSLTRLSIVFVSKNNKNIVMSHFLDFPTTRGSAFHYCVCVWFVIRAQCFKTFVLYFADMVRKIDSVFEFFFLLLQSKC